MLVLTLECRVLSSLSHFLSPQCFVMINFRDWTCFRYNYFVLQVELLKKLFLLAHYVCSRAQLSSQHQHALRFLGFFWGGLFNIHVTVNRDNFISSLKIYMLLKIILAELPSEKCGIRVAREVPSQALPNLKGGSTGVCYCFLCQVPSRILVLIFSVWASAPSVTDVLTVLFPP